MNKMFRLSVIFIPEETLLPYNKSACISHSCICRLCSGPPSLLEASLPQVERAGTRWGWDCVSIKLRMGIKAS